MMTIPLGKQRFLNTAHELKKWSFFWAIVLLCGYEGLIQYFQPKGFNPVKIVIASAMLIAFCILVRIAWKRIQTQTAFSYFFACYYVIYISYCLITVLSSFQLDAQVIANLLGNYTTGLGLMVPLIAVAGDRIIYHHLLLRTALKLIIVGVFLVPLGLIEGRMALFASPFVQLSYLILPFWLYLNKKQRQVVILGLVACLLTGLLTNVRSVIVREFLIIGVLSAFYILRQKSTITIIAIVIAFFITVGLIVYAPKLVVLFNQREIEVFGIKIDNDQNRDWMYEEVYSDLAKHDDLTFGRGALGKYFSSFFYSVYENEGESADNYYRYNIEVGILGYLLKGGFVLLFATLGLLFSACLLAFFKSKNTYIEGLGIVIFCHILVLSVENFPKLATYDLVIWLYVGACLSASIRTSVNPFQSLNINPRSKSSQPVTFMREMETAI